MLKVKSILYFLLALACFAGPGAVLGSAASASPLPLSELAGGGMSGKMVSDILHLALDEWPQPNNYNYGMLRSAYSHGTLTIEAHPSLTDAYNVSYGGLVVCVQLPI